MRNFQCCQTPAKLDEVVRQLVHWLSRQGYLGDGTDGGGVNIPAGHYGGPCTSLHLTSDNSLMFRLDGTLRLNAKAALY